MSNFLAPIKRIKVIDDDPAARQAYTWSIEAADCEPVPETGPLGRLNAYLKRPKETDAAISDLRLWKNNYADFNGAQLLKAWYDVAFPAVLCTSFDKSSATELRSIRRWLPVVMSPEQLSPDTLVTALEYARQELRDDFSAERRPWRALVHFVDFDGESNTASAKLPGWGPEAISLRLVDLPSELSTRIRRETDVRCHARANLGAQSNDELYVSEWEI